MADHEAEAAQLAFGLLARQLGLVPGAGDLLAGVALGIICSALMTWAVYFSTSFDLRQLMYWMMGGFGGVDWQQLWLMIALLPVLCWVCLQSQPLNLLALGEVSARQLGLPLWLWRKLLVVATGWLPEPFLTRHLKESTR